jgi:hypothetical protein
MDTYANEIEYTELRSKPSQVWQGHQDHLVEKEIVLGKLDIHMQKNEVGPWP